MITCYLPYHLSIPAPFQQIHQAGQWFVVSKKHQIDFLRIGKLRNDFCQIIA
jgi:hypothetical protein